LNLAIMLFILFDPLGSAPLFSVLLAGKSDADAKSTSSAPA
jgi:small neutral amino acid transporter SnatA (MarC family)